MHRRQWVHVLSFLVFTAGTAVITYYPVFFGSPQAPATSIQTVSGDLATATTRLRSEDELVRIAGVYELERLGKASRQDHWAVVQLLSEFVRARSPWTHAKEDQRVNLGWKEYLRTVPTLPSDVQAALTALGRRDQWRQHDARSLAEVEPERLNLTNADLRRADLRKLYLDGVDWELSHLELARLDDADLAFASMIGANLQGAVLSGACVDHASFAHARMDGVAMSNTNAAGALFWRTTFENSAFLGTNMTKSSFLTQAQVEQAAKCSLDSLFPDGIRCKNPEPAFKRDRQCPDRDYVPQAFRSRHYSPQRASSRQFLRERTPPQQMPQPTLDEILADRRKR